MPNIVDAVANAFEWDSEWPFEHDDEDRPAALGDRVAALEALIAGDE